MLWDFNKSSYPQGLLYSDHCWTVLCLETYVLKVQDFIFVMKYLYFITVTASSSVCIGT